MAQGAIVNEHVFRKRAAWRLLLALPMSLASFRVDFCDPVSTLPLEVGQEHGTTQNGTGLSDK
jgi:hypothetical protein